MRGNRSADTARTLMLVGLILDIIFEVVLLAFGLLFLVVPILGAVVLSLALIGFVWIALIWTFSYRRVDEGDYDGARTPTLVFAILSLITAALIPGILFLIAYVKLGDAIEAGGTATPAWGSPPPTPTFALPASSGAASRFCTHCGRPNPTSSAYCQGCGAPLT